MWAFTNSACVVRSSASWSHKLFVGFVFDVLFFSVIVPICLGSCPFCSAHLTQRFCAQVGKMLRRLPHSVLKNCGPRVVKRCINTLNDLIVWCLFCWRTSGTEHRRRGQYPQMGSTRHFI